MHQPLFTVAVKDVERKEQEREWTVPLQWLEWALHASEAGPTSTPGRLTATVEKNGGQFLVRGTIEVQVQLPCARTLEPAIYDLRPQLFLMLTQQGGAPGRATRRSRTVEEPGALTEEDAAHDTFSGEVIALDPFVREQVLLELPMFPLRSDLRSEASAAIGAPPENSAQRLAVDPRLAPLQKLADQLRAKSNPSNAEPPPPPSKPPAKK